MSIRIITRGLKTGTGAGGVNYILMRGLASDLNPPDPSDNRLIIIAIVNKLKMISMSRGFFTDINSCVDDWRFTDVQVSELPCIEVRDISEEIERHGTFDRRTLEVEIIGRLTITDMKAVRNFQQDIESAMTGGGGPMYPDSVYQSVIAGRGEIDIEQNNNKLASITLTYEVKYRTRVV